jgi:KaiC/GvpD/RAD55 family RecA-like ATPase
LERRPQQQREALLSRKLSALLDGDGFSPGLVLLVGPTGVGKTTFMKHLSYEKLKQGHTILWLTTEELPSTLQRSFQDFGWKINGFVETKKLRFIDAVSTRRFGTPEAIDRNVYYLDPTSLLVSVSDFLWKATSQDSKVLVVFDSISRIVTANRAKVAIELVASLNTRIESMGGLGFATVDEGVHSARVLNALKFSSTGVIEMRYIEGNKGLERKMRILRIRGMGHETKWVDFSITNASGFEMLSPASGGR